MALFDSNFAESAPAAAPEPIAPAAVKATPYAWRDPADIPLRPWILGRQKMRGQVDGKFAPGATGKTTHEVAVHLSLVTGRPLVGQTVWDGPKRTWMWNLEDNGDELARIIQATAKHWSITEADVGGRLFVDSALEGAVLKLATQTSHDGVIINEPLVEGLIAELKARQIDYLSVDPFISSHDVEENDNGAIDAVIKKWAYVAKQANCAIGLTHHVRKNGGGEVTSDSARGASSLVAAVRSALVLNRMNQDEADGWGIGPEERRRYFRVYDDKNNRAPPADKSDWFKIVSVDLGNGGLAAGDNIGVVEPWLPPEPLQGITRDHLHRVQVLIDAKGDVRENAQATRWVGKLVAEVLSLNDSDPKDRKVINSAIRTWRANGALKEVVRLDKNGDERKFIEVGEWAVDGPKTKQSAPAKSEVRTGAGGADRKPQSAPAPPLYRGAGAD